MTPSRKGVKLRRLLLILALAGSVLVLGFSWFTEWYCTARPPSLTAEPAILKATLKKEGKRTSLGESWMAKENGLICLNVAGDPFTLGYANACLTQQYMQKQEESLYLTVRQFVPSPVKFWLLTRYVYWMNRRLPEFIRPDYQMEILGLSRGYEDPYPGTAPLYHRILNYHAAHDISHAVIDSPLLGCTSFAAWGSMTASGHLLLGRNFDFNPGRWFDENKVVIRVKPDRGLGFISVAWSGMAGAVSGINEARLAVTINAARSAPPQSVGTPVSLLMREVLQYAHTIGEAVEIIRRRQVFVSDLYLVADGKTNQAVVVEKTPTRCVVWRPAGEYLISANHFLTDDLKNDPDNLKYLNEGSSLDRYARMEALVRQQAGRLTPETTAAILRDRLVPGGKNAGYGNEAALNALIATHAVIIDATQGVIWVSQTPHQLGGFIPFDLEGFHQPRTATAIGPDPMLANGAYGRFLAAQGHLQRARDLLKSKNWEAARAAAQEAGKLNPDFYLSWLLLGKIALGQGNRAEAREYLQKAQECYPAFPRERQEVARLLAELAEHARAPGSQK